MLDPVGAEAFHRSSLPSIAPAINCEADFQHEQDDSFIDARGRVGRFRFFTSP